MARTRKDPPRWDDHREQRDASVVATTEAAANLRFLTEGLPDTMPIGGRTLTVRMKNNADFISPTDTDSCSEGFPPDTGYWTVVQLEVNGEKTDEKWFCFHTGTTEEARLSMGEPGKGDHNVRVLLKGGTSKRVNDTLESTITIGNPDDGGGGGGKGKCGEGMVWVPTEEECRPKKDVSFWGKLTQTERYVLGGAGLMGAAALLTQNGGR